MKKSKIIEKYEFIDLPELNLKKLYEKMYHCGGSCSWYPGDGFFKPLSEVKNINNILFLGKENINTPNVYVYEKGDDIIGDFIMDKFKIKLCEEVLIK
mgnify:CR=1 FL=1